MNFKEILSDSIKYPSKGWGKVVVLGIILAIPIVNIIGIGYFLRVMKATIAGFDDLPDFDDAWNMFVDGLKLLVVSIIYFIPIIILYVLLYLSKQTTSVLLITLLYLILYTLILLPFVLIFASRSVMLLASNK